MRMQASIASSRGTSSGRDSSKSTRSTSTGNSTSTGSSQPSQRELTRSHSKASVRENHKAVRSIKKTKSQSAKDEDDKVDGEPIAHSHPPVDHFPVEDIAPNALTSVDSGITTPATIRPDQEALTHLDSSPSYESTYGGKPRTSEKYKEPKKREHRRGDRPPRSSSRRRESSDDRRRSRSRSGRREEHPERRQRSRSRSHRRSHHHNDYYAEDRRRSRSRSNTRHRESSKDHHREKSAGGALFQPRIPFLAADDDSTGNSILE